MQGGQVQVFTTLAAGFSWPELARRYNAGTACSLVRPMMMPFHRDPLLMSSR